MSKKKDHRVMVCGTRVFASGKDTYACRLRVIMILKEKFNPEDIESSGFKTRAWLACG